jgi:phenylacetate-CoA ligase
MVSTLEKQSKEQVKAFQEGKLKETLQYVSQYSPFYRRHFQKNGIDISEIKSLDDLKVIPPTTKDDLQQSNGDFLCVPRNKIMEYTTTSGTLGKPVIVALTENDLQRLTRNEFESLSCADGTPDDLYQLMLTLDRQFMAGIAYYEGLRKIGAGIVRTGPGLPELQLDTILTIKPTTLIAVPSFLVKIIEMAIQKGIDLNATSVKKVVCIGENIRTVDFQMNTLAKKIVQHWNVQLYSTYASTEMQTAFTECSHGHGGHHQPELIIAEVLDDHNSPVPPGTEGELTITHIGVEGMPLVRYKTGDMVIMNEAPCACGRTTARISPVIGRKQNMIKLKGTTIYPPGIFEILHQVNISDYVVEVFTNTLGTDELRLHVFADEVTCQRVKSIFQSRFRILPEVLASTQQQIEQMQLSDGSRKPKKFIDRR